MSPDTHTARDDDSAKFGQGPPHRGWKEYMSQDPTEYSPEFQDEYRRLWREAAAKRDALVARVEELEALVRDAIGLIWDEDAAFVVGGSEKLDAWADRARAALSVSAAEEDKQ